MKTLLIVLLAASTLALGTLNLLQARKAARQAERMTSLEVEIQQRGEQIAELERAQVRAQHYQRDLVKLSEDMAAALETKQRELTNAAQLAGSEAARPAGQDGPAKSAKDFGRMLSNMMKDPEMKKMIEDQQRGMLESLYGPFVKQANLTTEEAQAFKDILLGNMGRAQENAAELLGASTNRSEAIRRMAEERSQTEEQLRTLLGDDRYAQYKDYETTAGDRAQLTMFRQQNFGEHAISDAQNEQLLAIMREEKQNLAPVGASGGGMAGDPTAAIEGLFNSDEGERMLDAQQGANERIFERARAVLDEGQLGAFGAYQTNQLRMMRMGLNMTRRILTPAKGGE